MAVRKSSIGNRRKPHQLFATAAMTGLLAGAAVQVGCKPDSSTSTGASATTQPGAPATTMAAQHSCKGQNACKGQGGCGTSTHDCKGKNACKGQGGCASSM
jgi:hypothetical protein